MSMGGNIRDWRPGQVITADRLNEMIRATIISVLGGSDIIAQSGAGGTTLSYTGDQNSAGGTVIRPFVVTDVKDNWLECRPYKPLRDTWYSEIGGGQDETGVSDETVLVCKPPELQRWLWDGKTFTYDNGDTIEYTYDATEPHRKREADNGTSTESQVITPDYIIADVADASLLTAERSMILAARVVTGITDTIADLTTGNPITGTPINWMDLNVAGRCWATEPA